ENTSFDPGILFDIDEEKLPVVFIVVSEITMEAVEQLSRFYDRRQFFLFFVILSGGISSESWKSKIESAFPLVVWMDSKQPFGEVTKSLERVEREYRHVLPIVEFEDAPVDSAVVPGPDEAPLESLFRYTPKVDFSKSKLGLQFALPKSRASFDAEKEISNPIVRAELLDFMRVHSSRSFSHVRRVFTTGRDIQQSTKLWNLEPETLETAFTMYLSTCGPREQSLITGNYLDASAGTVELLAQRVESASVAISEKTGDTKAAGLVSGMGALLLRKSSPEDSEQADSASLLLGLDLLDRNCWSHGHWQPRWAKRFLNSILDNEIAMLSRNTAWTLLQLMVNAFENLHTVKNVLIRKVQDEYGNEQVIPREARATVDDGVRVSLSQLKPGMVLAGAVCTTDGTEILPKNFEIDTEIIVRLWNLSATRAIHTPQVTEESFEACQLK
ncbi:MAG: hypothetical protein KDD62_09785, partial [Bdellovibrionales bacterium]|nr:hypothetical protein [Bdellovibrionales bacterium]